MLSTVRSARSAQTIQISIAAVQDEVRALIGQGVVGRYQRIYTLCQYFPLRDWLQIEALLETHDYLLRDCVSDLVGREDWGND